MTVRPSMSRILVLWLYLVSLAGWAQAPSEHLRRAIEYAHDSGDPEFAGTRLIAVDFLARFYEARHFEPAWGDKGNMEIVLAALEASDRHGLLPRDFHMDAIQLLREMQSEQPNDPRLIANLDLLLTDGLVTYAYQLVYGKVDPRALSASWNLSRPLLSREPEEILQSTLEEGNLEEVLASLIPDLPYYADMRTQLAKYRQSASRGGWPTVPDGETLSLGDRDPRVAAVRARLASDYGEIEAPEGDPQIFDEALEQSVRRFQTQHALDVDGSVGPATRRAMNISAAQRVDQIRVNLERARWVQREFNDVKDFVIVNIAGFNVRLYRDGQIAWEARAIVGTEYQQTPIFAADMQYVVLNPTWTVPRSIIRNEMLPQMRTDPGYLPARNFLLFDEAGNSVDPTALDWASFDSENFPYGLVQRAGRGNTLGAVKFMFPNSHSVYLHDTPNRELFDRDGRTFSHGCVRIENPLELATRLLGDQLDWSRDAIDQTIEDGETTTVYLTEPLRVFVLYWTAEPSGEEGIRFYEDVYERDAAVLAALDAEFRSLTPADR